MLAFCLASLCSAFTWPGRAGHYVYSLQHGPELERISAIRWLEQQPSAEGLQALLGALDDPEPRVRAQAAATLGELGAREATDTLLEWAWASAASQRSQALEALGGLADPRVPPIVARGLSDQDANVRLAAIHALGQSAVRDGTDWTPLLAALSDNDPELRLAAIVQLDASGRAASTRLAPTDARTHDQARRKLFECARDADVRVRAASLRALGHLRDAQTLAALTRALTDGDEAVRLAAIAALGDSGQPGAVTALRVTMSGPARATLTALAALGRLDESATVPLLATQLSRPEYAAAALTALLGRAQRLNATPAWQETAGSVRAALTRTERPELVALLAQALYELAPFTDVRAAEPQLSRALQAGQADPVLLTRALLALHSRDLATNLAARLRAADETTIAPVLDALDLALRAGVNAEALDPVLAERLPAASATTRPHVLSLLALAHSDGPWRASATASSLELQALADVLGALPATSERREQLLALLEAPQASVREHAAVAIARSADAATLQALYVRLTRPAASQAHLLLQAIAGALVRLDGGKSLATNLRTALFERISGVDLLSPQPEIAASALLALRSFADARTAPRIAQLLQTGSASLRSAALLALGDFELKDTRRLLRSALQNESARNVVHVVIAFAEVGTEHDADTLARVAERGVWPLPAAAAYAVARIAQRGVTKKHTLERVLCRLGRLPDVYVRANVATGLAALAAPTCDGQVAPQDWLDPSLPSPLRAAAARWLRASNGAQVQEPLAQCASDPDPSVSRACRDEQEAPARQREVLLQALAVDGAKQQREQLVALRFADGSVFIGQSDANGQLLLRHVPVGPIVLEDPADAEPLATVRRRPSLPRTSSLSSEAVWAEDPSRARQNAAVAGTP